MIIDRERKLRGDRKKIKPFSAFYIARCWYSQKGKEKYTNIHMQEEERSDLIYPQ